MRLFIALPLPLEVEEYLSKIIFAFKQKKAGINWVAPKNIHLTVKFLGESEDAKVPSITSAIDSVARAYPVLHATVDAVGAFPDMKRPRVIWAGMSGDIDKMAGVAIDIENAMSEFGFEKENRPFKPHLTLGRVKDVYGLSDLTTYLGSYNITPTDLTLDKIVLFKSTLTPRGPIYDRLHEGMLGG